MGLQRGMLLPYALEKPLVCDKDWAESKGVQLPPGQLRHLCRGRGASDVTRAGQPCQPRTDLLSLAVGSAQQHVEHVCLPQAHQGVLHEAVVWQSIPHHVTQRLKQCGGWS